MKCGSYIANAEYFIYTNYDLGSCVSSYLFFRHLLTQDRLLRRKTDTSMLISTYCQIKGRRNVQIIYFLKTICSVCNLLLNNVFYPVPRGQGQISIEIISCSLIKSYAEMSKILKLQKRVQKKNIEQSSLLKQNRSSV